MATILVNGLVVPVGILQVTVHNQFFSSGRNLVGIDWRMYVWGCRNEEPIHQIFTSSHDMIKSLSEDRFR